MNSWIRVLVGFVVGVALADRARNTPVAPTEQASLAEPQAVVETAEAEVALTCGTIGGTGTMMDQINTSEILAKARRTAGLPDKAANASAQSAQIPVNQIDFTYSSLLGFFWRGNGKKKTAA